MTDTLSVLIAVGIGIFFALPYLGICWRLRIQANMATFFAIIVSVVGVIAAIKLAYVTVNFGVNDPKRLGVFQGNDVVVVVIGALSMMWMSFQGAFYAYAPLYNAWKEEGDTEAEGNTQNA